MKSSILPKPRLDDLLRLLVEDGYEIVGPRIEQAAIIYGPLRSAKELPIGWTDRQTPGAYRLERRQDEWYFGYAVGPHSWKKYLFPPMLRLWEAKHTSDGFEAQSIMPNPPRRAFLGMRACELHALAIQDRVFLNREGRFTDPYYAAARARLVLIAVECEHPGGTCFCSSMGTGPEVRTESIPAPSRRELDNARQLADDRPGRTALPMATSRSDSDHDGRSVCDLVLTELDDAFVIRAASVVGQDILERLNLEDAAGTQIDEARQRVTAAAQAMGRRLDTNDIHGLLHRNQEHPRWDDVAARCLACTNCTLVCPTCFCSSTEDVTDLGLEKAERVRRWDSCFNPEFGRVHGGNFRPSIRARYRQWLTHKFASWFDQFEVSGCVGCGRCITWCPVGIDVTEEIAAIRATASLK